MIVGPTGTGKSELAVEVARRLDGEIVGCDALQVYRGLDAATAKPSPDQRRAVPHHLIDVVDPAHDFSLAEYVERAEQATREVLARGRVPIVVGGTGLYLRGLLRGVVPAPPRNERLRARLRRLADRHGTPRLHHWLRGRDPRSAARLRAGDTQRVVRALEVALSGGDTLGRTIERNGTWAAGRERFPNVKAGLDADRKWLHPRLDRRVEAFFEAGLVAEVRRLLVRVPREANAFKAIGYREVLRWLDGHLSETELVTEIQRNTRRYVKRQRTWFRKEPGLHWLDAARPLEELIDSIVGLYRHGLGDESA